MWKLSSVKIARLDRRWDAKRGAPVFTVRGKYTSRGWTEWTQGFQFGSSLLQFAATGETAALTIGRRGTVRHMASHVTHVGVHDHGFNNVSTYGVLRQLACSGRFSPDHGEVSLYELALKASGAVQAARWTELLKKRSKKSGHYWRRLKFLTKIAFLLYANACANGWLPSCANTSPPSPPPKSPPISE